MIFWCKVNFFDYDFKKLRLLGISFLWLFGVLVLDPSLFGSLMGTCFKDLIHVMDYALTLFKKLPEVGAVHVFG